MENEDTGSTFGTLKNIFPQWFITLNNFLGALPIIPNEFGVLKYNPISSIRALIFIILVVCSFYYFPPNLNYNPFLELVEIISSHMLPGGFLIIILVNNVRCYRQEYQNITNSIVQFQKFWLSKNSTCHEKNNSSRKVVIWLIVSKLSLAPMHIYLLWNFESLSIWDINKNFCIMHFELLKIAYIMIVSSVGDSFKRLNKLVKYCDFNPLDHFFHRSITFPVPPTKDNPRVTMEEIGEIHFMLCKTIEKTNTFFGIQMIFVFILLFIDLTVRPFFSWGTLMGITKLDDLFVTFTWNFGNFLLCAFELVYICWISSQVTNHAKQTAFHVSSLLSLDLSRDIKKKVKYGLSQIFYMQPYFTILDLKKIELPLIPSILGLAVSYAIVILQYQLLSNK